MRFLFKTDYDDDIRLLPHSGYVFSYGTLLVLLVIAPFVLSSYLMSQLVFVCIYATVGVALLILTGFTGQASLGHAAFLAIGAYTATYLQQFGVPFVVYFLAAGLFAGIARMHTFPSRFDANTGDLHQRTRALGFVRPGLRYPGWSRPPPLGRVAAARHRTGF